MIATTRTRQEMTNVQPEREAAKTKSDLLTEVTAKQDYSLTISKNIIEY